MAVESICELRKDAAWALLAPTSMGVRLTPLDGQPVHCSDTFRMQATSAESNVATIAAALGLPVKILTTLVKDSPIAAFIRRELRGRNMTVEAVEVEPGGPWGYRHQFNIADSGCGVRGPRVHNDRAGEVGRTLCAADFDLERIFATEGVRVMHLSGLLAALAPGTGAFCLELARTARRHGTRVAFDLNHRASFWQGRAQELRAVFGGIAAHADILIGNEEDFQLCLGIAGPEAGGADLAGRTGCFKDMIGHAAAQYPNARVFATTLRQVLGADQHLWGAVMRAGDAWHVVDPRPIRVLDRIGGGDGFVGGLLYGMLRGWPAEQWIQFGWACGALATTFLSDCAQPADEAMVWDAWRGNARVRR
jgi:2-dehydro-3-deoxygluconokinase